MADTVESTTPVTTNADPSAPRMSVFEGLGANVIGVFPCSIFDGKIDT